MRIRKCETEKFFISLILNNSHLYKNLNPSSEVLTTFTSFNHKRKRITDDYDWMVFPQEKFLRILFTILYRINEQWLQNYKMVLAIID